MVEDPEFAPSGSDEKYAVADLVTGYGVAESVRHFYNLYKKTDLKGKRVIIQGWGNVAAAAGYYLAQQGAKIVGIIDREGGILSNEGLDFNAVKSLFLHKKGNKLQSTQMLPFETVNEKIWSIGAEIFIPGAASRLINKDHVQQMIQNGIEVISCGANVPFVDDDVFFGQTARETDAKIALIPDFIANCGMARVFAYLMQPDVPVTDRSIFQDISQTIRRALEEVHKTHPSANFISSNALKLALNKLGIS